MQKFYFYAKGHYLGTVRSTLDEVKKQFPYAEINECVMVRAYRVDIYLAIN